MCTLACTNSDCRSPTVHVAYTLAIQACIQRILKCVAVQIMDFLNPLPADIEYLPMLDKIMEIIKIPVVLLLKITVPVVDRGLPRK
jgi:hypothetical protein